MAGKRMRWLGRGTAAVLSCVVAATGAVAVSDAALAQQPDAATNGVSSAGDAAPTAPAASGESAEALRLGPLVKPRRPYPFPLLGDDRAKEIYVDRAGKLYKDRPYSGLVPDWTAARTARRRSGRCEVVEQPLVWIGFQNNFDSSRIFVQVEQEACGYVYRPDDTHIVIDLPAVRVPYANLKNDILTGAFPTAVELVHVDEFEGRGTRITITLKAPRRYLSAHLGKYVFVDVAR